MIFDTLKCAFRNVIRKKSGSLLTIIGISIGIASFIIISTISSSGTTVICNELNSLGLGGISISAEGAQNIFGALSDKELNAVKAVSSVKNATPVIMRNGEVFTKNTGSHSVLLWGIDSKANQIVSIKPVYGRMINSSDVKSSSHVCMIDQNFSNLIYKRDNSVGKKISICIGTITEEFNIVGITKTGSGVLQNMMGNFIPNFIYIPYTTMQTVTGSERFDQIAVKLNEKSDIEVAGKNIVNLLNNKSEGNLNYKVNSFVKQKDGLLKLMDIITVILTLVSAISLLVASLNIMTIMLVSVNERKREIGIKKSIGAKRYNIMFEFLLEALCLTTTGTIVGILIGTIISYSGSMFMGVYFNMKWSLILISLLFSIISGAVFGIYPALKASRLNPVDALESRN